MASPLQQIVPSTQLAGSAGLLYTSPPGFDTQIVALNAVNVDTSTHTITLYIVPFGEQPGAATTTTSANGLLAGQNYNGQNEYGMVLGPGDALWGQADTPSVITIAVSGLVNS